MYSYLYLNFSNYGPRTSSIGITKNLMDFPGGSDVKQSTCNVRDLGSILGLGRYSGARHGNAFRNSYLENPMDNLRWDGTQCFRERISSTLQHSPICWYLRANWIHLHMSDCILGKIAFLENMWWVEIIISEADLEWKSDYKVKFILRKLWFGGSETRKMAHFWHCVLVVII